ncbi:nucleic-acid binding, partial [Lasius niger]
SKFEEQHDILVTVHRKVWTTLDYAVEFARQNQPPESPTMRTKPVTSRSTLPRIQLPQFSEKYEDWPAFQDLFQFMIGRDCNLSGSKNSII